MLVGLARVVVFCTVGRNASEGAKQNKNTTNNSWPTPSTVASGTVVLDLFSTKEVTNLVLCVGVSDFLDNVVGTTYLRESCGLEDLLFLVSKPPAAVSCTYSSLCVGPGWYTSSQDKRTAPKSLISDLPISRKIWFLKQQILVRS